MVPAAHVLDSDLARRVADVVEKAVDFGPVLLTRVLGQIGHRHLVLRMLQGRRIHQICIHGHGDLHSRDSAHPGHPDVGYQQGQDIALTGRKRKTTTPFTADSCVRANRSPYSREQVDKQTHNLPGTELLRSNFVQMYKVELISCSF